MGEDEANRVRIEAKNSLENYAYSMKNTMADEKLAGKLSDGDKKSVEDKINETISWLDANQSAEKEEYEQKQKELEGVVNPILQNLSGGMPGGMPDMGGGAPADDAGADEGPKIEEIDYASE